MGIVPALEASGVYAVSAPFVAPEGAIYRCTSVSTMAGMEREGIDVYQRVYVPHELPEEAYVDDRANGVKIVHLSAETDHPDLLIPSSYIEGVADPLVAVYKRHVMTVDLGLLEESTSLDFLRQGVIEFTQNGLGLTPQIDVLAVPITDTLSKEDARRLEEARAATKKFQPSDHAAMQYWMQRALSAEAYISRLESALVDLRK